jgi:hypothetical protein
MHLGAWHGDSGPAGVMQLNASWITRVMRGVASAGATSSVEPFAICRNRAKQT